MNTINKTLKTVAKAAQKMTEADRAKLIALIQKSLTLPDPE